MPASLAVVASTATEQQAQVDVGGCARVCMSAGFCSAKSLPVGLLVARSAPGGLQFVPGGCY